MIALQYCGDHLRLRLSFEVTHHFLETTVGAIAPCIADQHQRCSATLSEFRRHGVFIPEDKEALAEVLEFTQIARPWITHTGRQEFTGHADRATSIFICHSLNEVPDKAWNLFGTFTQWGDFQG